MLKTSVVKMVLCAFFFVLIGLLSSCGGGGGSGSAGNGGTSSYSITVTVQGLIGTVVLQDNGGDNLSVAANGSASFATKLASGSLYAVSVLTQPSGQTCTVANGSGTVAISNLTTPTVSCSNNGGGTGSGGGSLTFSNYPSITGLANAYNGTCISNAAASVCGVGWSDSHFDATSLTYTIHSLPYSETTAEFSVNYAANAGVLLWVGNPPPSSLICFISGTNVSSLATCSSLGFVINVTSTTPIFSGSVTFTSSPVYINSTGVAAGTMNGTLTF